MVVQLSGNVKSKRQKAKPANSSRGLKAGAISKASSKNSSLRSNSGVISEKFYITTAIPYVNARPHIGHALEFVQTDAIARFQKLLGKEVFLTTGADENSLKNVQAAEKAGITTQRLCDNNAAIFRALAEKLGLSFNRFLRSSIRQDHWPGVQKLWELCKKSGDIYRKKYRGLYCVGCEAFYTESELVGGLCPEHQRKPEVVEEENYFFRLSKYQRIIENLIETDRLKIVPEIRKNEILSFVKSGLEDFSISRSVERAKGWGVPVPGDEKQIMYVWFDALGIYLTSIGYGTDEKLFRKWWPADVHAIGKGITRFHAVYWPAILLSAGLELPKTVFVHGYVTVEGQKMSKTIGNVVDPLGLLSRYSADTVRYFLLREVPATEDGDFSEKALITRHNTELADQLGNLLNRVLVLVEKHSGGTVPKGKPDKKIAKAAAETVAAAGLDMERYQFHHALEHIWKFVGELNAYVNEKKPWEIKSERARADVLYTLLEGLRFVGVLCWPFIPGAAEKVLGQAGAGRVPDIKSLQKFGRLEPGAKTNRGEVLFRKMEAGAGKAAIARQALGTGEISKVPRHTSGDGEISEIQKKISYDDFSKLDLRVAEIREAEEVKGSDKLVKLQIDLGAETRQIVAGIRKSYRPEELVGKQIAVVANLKPREYKGFGVTSYAMLLAAESDGKLVLVSPEKKVKPGSPVS